MKKLLIVCLGVVSLVACSSGSTGTGGGAGGGAAGGGAGGGAAGGGAGGGSGGGTGGGSGGGGPAVVTLTIAASCPALTGCGGDVVGPWEYNSGCVSTDTLFTAARQACSALTLTNVAGNSRGSVVFTSTQVTRAITTNLSGTMDFPAACNPTSSCASVQSALTGMGFKTLVCTDAAGGCSCAFTAQLGTTGVAPYTKGTNQFTTDPGTPNAVTYDYCVSGSGTSAALTYRELGTNPHDPGIFKMTVK